MHIALAGEGLIDFTGSGGMAFQGHCGGSPLNVAVACARLGQPTAYLTQLSTDLFGEQLLQHLQGNGVDTRYVTRSDAPSTVAFVERGPQTNRYAFYSRGSADSGWAPDPLPQLPESCRFLHFGSISLLQDPAASAISRLIAANAGERIIVFDPNVRLSLIDDLAAYRWRCEQWLRHTDLLKLSDEDVEALAPGVDHAAAAAIWLQAGVRAVVITRGGDGATLYRQTQAPLHVAAPQVEVVDTIGAGDTFTAGLSVALLQQGVSEAADLATLPDAGWLQVMRCAAHAAALSCARAGANPPALDQVQEALRQA
ncbi:MAG: carbohydrate kinase [Propionivibrio sp.]